MSSSVPPAPNGQVLSLVSALASPENHDLHLQAIKARDDALGGSQESYGALCLQLAFLLVGSDNPQQLLPRIDPNDLQIWTQTDGATTSAKLQSDPSMWTPFGQMAGLILKNALIRPPIRSGQPPLQLQSPTSDHLKETLLYGLSLNQHALQNVISSTIASCSVNKTGVQPQLHISQWPRLMPTLISNISSNSNPAALEVSVATIQKMMEDGASEIPATALDELVPLLLNLFSAPQEAIKISALQSLVACLAEGILPSALLMKFSDYLQGLSTLASDPSPTVRKWVCRSINTILEYHTMYLQEHMASISQFILQQTSLQNNVEEVATEACEFWILFASMDEYALSAEMLSTVEALLPQLIPTLLQNMVYSEEQRIDLQAQNEIDLEEANQSQQQQVLKPVFHKSKNKHGGDGDEDDDDGDDDEYENEWTLRRLAGASLDSLAAMYGAEPILPSLLPALQHGLGSQDQWVQEASILALGAIAEGCQEEMNVHLGQVYPHLMQLLAQPETPEYLPQVKSICAWTIGRYAPWAVEQVQTGAQGHLLAHMTELFLKRLEDKNRNVQVAVASAFGVIMESAGDLMVPYLEPICNALAQALFRYQGRSLMVLYDALGAMAEFVGTAVGERDLPEVYIPPLLHQMDMIMKHDPTNQTLLPLMEALAIFASVCGTNYQPYALETFEASMTLIQQIQLILVSNGTAIAEEDADPIVCAADLLDGLCEGMGGNFAALVSSSSRFRDNFTTVLKALCSYEVASVRMSAFALLGDIARNCPGLIEPALPELLREAVTNCDPIQPTVCNNAVWAIGEICVQCGDNATLLEPFAGPLMQQLIALLMGNGPGHVNALHGLPEAAAACVGRVAKLNPNFVAPDLNRFLLGWCDGMAKITDPTERHDAFVGFAKAVYANPQAIDTAANSKVDAIASILFAIVSWHMPPETPDEVEGLLQGEYQFHPFPPAEAELGMSLAQLMRDIRTSVGDDVWQTVQHRMPVNVRRLLREAYQM